MSLVSGFLVFLGLPTAARFVWAALVIESGTLRIAAVLPRGALACNESRELNTTYHYLLFGCASGLPAKGSFCQSTRFLVGGVAAAFDDNWKCSTDCPALVACLSH